jgi:thiol-disulfide isomerase/thioredoxin
MLKIHITTRSAGRVLSGFALVTFLVTLAGLSIAQTNAQITKKTKVDAAAAGTPKVAVLDFEGLKDLLKPNGRPRLVNFWATWCDPCVEEFPELVQIDKDYSGKVDLITISMDDPAEINRDVPAFLLKMNAKMPAYLLHVADEEAAVKTVSPDWKGGLPFTVLFNPKGEAVYIHMGRIKQQVLRVEIDKQLNSAKSTEKTAGADKKVDSINEQPFKDLIQTYKERILNKEIDLNAPINIEITGGLDENGRLVRPKVADAGQGNIRLSQLIKDAASAGSDSGVFKSLFDMGARNISITVNQDKDNFAAAVKTELPSNQRSMSASSVLQLALKSAGPSPNADLNTLRSRTTVSADGNFLKVTLTMPAEEKTQMIERNLRILPEGTDGN